MQEEDKSEKEKHYFIVNPNLSASEMIESLLMKEDIHLEHILDAFSITANKENDSLLFESKSNNLKTDILPLNSLVFYSHNDINNNEISLDKPNSFNKINDYSIVYQKTIKERFLREQYEKSKMIAKLKKYSLSRTKKSNMNEVSPLPTTDGNQFFARFDRVTGQFYYEDKKTNEKFYHTKQESRKVSEKDLWKLPYKNTLLIDFFMNKKDLDIHDVDATIYSTIQTLTQWIEQFSLSLPSEISLYQCQWPVYLTSMYPPCTTYEYEVSLYFSQLATTHVSFVVDLRSTVTQLLSDANEYISKFRFLSVNFSTCILKIKDRNDYLCLPDLPLLNYSSIQTSFLNKRSINLSIDNISTSQLHCLKAYVQYLQSHPLVPISFSNIPLPATDAELISNPLLTSPSTLSTLPYSSYLLGTPSLSFKRSIDSQQYLYSHTLPTTNVITFDLDISTPITELLTVNIGLFEGLFPLFTLRNGDYTLLQRQIQYNPKDTFYVHLTFPLSISFLTPSTSLLMTIKTSKCIYAVHLPLVDSSSCYITYTTTLQAKSFPLTTSLPTILYSYYSLSSHDHTPLYASFHFPDYLKPIYITKHSLPPRSPLSLSLDPSQDIPYSTFQTIFKYPPYTLFSLQERRLLYQYKDLLLYAYLPDLYEVQDSEKKQWASSTASLSQLYQENAISIDTILYCLYSSINFLDSHEIDEYLNILLNVFPFLFPFRDPSSPFYFISPLTFSPTYSFQSFSSTFFSTQQPMTRTFFEDSFSQSPTPLTTPLDPPPPSTPSSIHSHLDSSTFNIQYPNEKVCPSSYHIAWLLGFFSPTYSYPLIQLIALEYLNTIEDTMLTSFLPLLVQLLAYQRTLDNPLLRFLLYRILRSPSTLGHELFWILRSELYQSQLFPSLFILLCLYLFYGGSYLNELAKQVAAHHFVVELYTIIHQHGKDSLLPLLNAFISKKAAYIPSTFLLPFSPRYIATGIRFNKLRIMSSKKAPLLLYFKNAYNEDSDIPVLYKDGDDLRQDRSILMIFTYAANFLRYSGYTIYLNDYIVMPTEENKGYIQVVQHSRTLKELFEEKNVYTGAMTEDVIDGYLRQSTNSMEEYYDACDHFMNSVTIYIALTYLFGIADRHPSNIMIKKYGDLFHIDFGHILGNFKTIVGVKRETNQVVFNSQMLHVFGGEKSENYDQFLLLCSSIFLNLRRNWSSLYSLLEIVSLLSLPELSSINDLSYFYSLLERGEKSEKVIRVIKGKISSSFKSVIKRFDDSIHVLVHQSSKNQTPLYNNR